MFGKNPQVGTTGAEASSASAFSLSLLEAEKRGLAYGFEAEARRAELYLTMACLGRSAAESEN